jgi:hypothetical protein
VTPTTQQIVLQGVARICFGDKTLEMNPGDFVNIPPHKKHRVEWTTPDEPTIWIAVHYGDEECARTRASPLKASFKIIGGIGFTLDCCGNRIKHKSTSLVRAGFHPSASRSFPALSLSCLQGSSSSFPFLLTTFRYSQRGRSREHSITEPKLRCVSFTFPLLKGREFGLASRRAVRLSIAAPPTTGLLTHATGDVHEPKVGACPVFLGAGIAASRLQK